MNEVLRRVAYPLCIVSILAFAPLAIVAIWTESMSETTGKLCTTLLVVAFTSAMVLAATRAARNGRE